MDLCDLKPGMIMVGVMAIFIIATIPHLAEEPMVEVGVYEIIDFQPKFSAVHDELNINLSRFEAVSQDSISYTDRDFSVVTYETVYIGERFSLTHYSDGRGHIKIPLDILNRMLSGN